MNHLLSEIDTPIYLMDWREAINFHQLTDPNRNCCKSSKRAKRLFFTKIVDIEPLFYQSWASQNTMCVRTLNHEVEWNRLLALSQNWSIQNSPYSWEEYSISLFTSVHRSTNVPFCKLSGTGLFQLSLNALVMMMGFWCVDTSEVGGQTKAHHLGYSSCGPSGNKK